MRDAAAGRDRVGTRHRWHVPRERGALAEARRRVRQVLAGWQCPREQTDAVLLLVSELVTNAHRHAGGPAELEVRALPGGVRVVVGDGNASAVPAQREPGIGGGYGMHLVERLGSRWGVEVLSGGKRIWVEVPG
ncbi:ATP-binding protein [Streptomyces sp. NPDC001380]|uniref:ATP-binding protein n=1 Tax=Streptomyces sp. NPDC001380 TaxID=3364566 RepID=UPI0036851400